MYVREIPEEYREEVKEIIGRITMIPKREDMERLFYLYYRYIKVISRGEDPIKRMKKDLNCGSCRGKVLYYFRNIVSEW